MTFQEFREKYNIKLNSQQLDAVQAVEGPVLLLAVPGSGKTTVLVTRLGYMLSCCGIASEQILTLTYTVAATKDMGERFAKIFGDELGERLEFRTINGLCARIIQFYGRMIGRSSFELASDEKFTAGILSGVYQQVQEAYPTESDIKNVRTLITYIKNSMLTPEEIEGLEELSDYKVTALYQEYCREMRSRGLMDYDDQMTYALNILRKSPETLAYFRQQYTYICVDEAQDTSRIQHAIIALLAGERGNLFMVGDEDQSIYGFRAAYPEALLSFEKDHPGGKVLLMEENFRSNARIVEAADRFIQKNTLRHEKHMKPSREAGAAIKEIVLKGRRAQYTYLEKVAESCSNPWGEESAPLDGANGEQKTMPKTAVLYRDNESALPLIDRLERKGIPYRMRSMDMTFFTHRIVLDIQNIIRFAANPMDTDAFMEIYYKVNFYMNKQNALRFCEISKQRQLPVLDVALKYGSFQPYQLGNLKAMRTHLKNLLQDTAEGAIDRIVKFMGYGDYLERMNMKQEKVFLLKILAAAVTTEDIVEDSAHAVEDVSGGCLEGMGQPKSMAEAFLVRLFRLQQLIREKENDPQCPFVLSTIHGSKGLEYDNVYLLDVEDGIFPESVPLSMKYADIKEKETYEEERRLFYVAVTRAKEVLHLFQLPGKSTFVRELLEDSAGGRTGTRSVLHGGTWSAETDNAPGLRQAGSKARGTYDDTLQKTYSSRAGKSGKKNTRAEYESFRASMRAGVEVHHKKYGFGAVSSVNEEKAAIQFAEEEREFLLDILFKSGLLEIMD